MRKMIPDLSSYWLNLPLIKIEHLCYFGIRMIKLQIVVVSTFNNRRISNSQSNRHSLSY